MGTWKKQQQDAKKILACDLSHELISCEESMLRLITTAFTAILLCFTIL